MCQRSVVQDEVVCAWQEVTDPDNAMMEDVQLRLLLKYLLRRAGNVAVHCGQAIDVEDIDVVHEGGGSDAIAVLQAEHPVDPAHAHAALLDRHRRKEEDTLLEQRSLPQQEYVRPEEADHGTE